jgi:hypothetical protein
LARTEICGSEVLKTVALKSSIYVILCSPVEVNNSEKHKPLLLFISYCMLCLNVSTAQVIGHCQVMYINQPNIRKYKSVKVLSHVID